MSGFLFRLVTVEREPGDAPRLSAAVPNRNVGDTMHVRGRTVRVVGRRDDDGDQPPVLVVEEMT